MADVDISSISFGDTTYNLRDPSKYEKPGDGIPYSHLEPSVRASLDKADSALQEVGEAAQAFDATVIPAADLVTFEAPGAFPLRDMLVNITPRQEGSGDPSSSNIRAISGVTKCSIYPGGENYKTGYTRYRQLSSTTGEENTGSLADYYCSPFIPASNSIYLDLQCSADGTRNMIVNAYNSEKQFLQNVYADTRAKNAHIITTYNLPEGTAFVRFSFGKGANGTVNYAFSLSQQGLKTSWEDEAGTVYAGTFNPLIGELRARPYYASYDGETLVGPWISDRDVYAEETTPTIGAQVVDLGGTETVYQLKPVEIKTMPGINNIVARLGTPYQYCDLSVTYGAYLETVQKNIASKSIFADEILLPTLTIKPGGVNYLTGEIYNSSSAGHTEYIDISEYAKIRFKHAGFTQDKNTIRAGLAFYDSSKNFIPDSGVQCKCNQSSPGYMAFDSLISIPSSAAFVRFSLLTDSNQYGDFYAYGTPKIVDSIKEEKIARIKQLNKIGPIDWNSWVGDGTYNQYNAWQKGYWDSTNETNNSKYMIQYWTYITTTSPIVAGSGGKLLFEIPDTYTLILQGFGGENYQTREDYYKIRGKQIIELTSGLRYRMHLRPLDDDGMSSSGRAPQNLVDQILITPIVKEISPKTSRGSAGFDKRDYFTVEINRAWPNPDATGYSNSESYNLAEIQCVIKLPLSYTPTGIKTPLIMFCHGAGGNVSTTSWYQNNSNFLKLIDEFNSAGYAVFDVDNTRNSSEGFSDWGSLPLMEAYCKAWDYIKRYYNVEDKLYICSDSMGTAANLNMMKWHGSDVIASFMTAPRPMGCALRSATITSIDYLIMYYVAWGLANDNALNAVAYDNSAIYSVGDYCIYNDTLQRCITEISSAEEFNQDHWFAYSTSLFSDSRFKGFGQYEDLVTIDGVKYALVNNFPPCKVMVGTNDTSLLAETREYYAALKRSGVYVNYREVAGADHAKMSFISEPGLRQECIDWFNRFRG